MTTLAEYRQKIDSELIRLDGFWSATINDRNHHHRFTEAAAARNTWTTLRRAEWDKWITTVNDVNARAAAATFGGAS